MPKLAIDGGPKAVNLKSPPWPVVGEAELSAVAAAMRSSPASWEYLCSAAGGGPTAEFDKAFAEFMGAEHAMCTSGGGPAWRGDQSGLVDQILDAFEKVTGDLDTLRDMEE